MSHDQLINEDDLEPHEKHFYKSLSPHLNNIRFYPKNETLLKILTYSKSKR